MSCDLAVRARALSPERPPVLLLGGLDLLRPLGYAGIPAIVASAEPQEPAFRSRYCAGRLRMPPLAQREAALGALLAAGERLRGALGARVPLFYGTDEHLDLIEDARETLERAFLLPLNPPGVSRALLDKNRFAALAHAHALPVPRPLRWQELAGTPGAVLAKPRVKVGWEASALRAQLLEGGKARIFASGRALLAHPMAARFREELAFQEYVAGDDRQLWSYHGYAAEDGALLGWFVGRKVRTLPALTGMSSCLELARDAEVAALGGAAAERLALRGPFKIDMKRCATTGRLFLLEVNARFNLWHHLGAASGVNLPRIAYEHLVHGARPAAAPAWRTGRRWLCPRIDRRACREQAGGGAPRFAAWLAAAADPRNLCDTFSWTDPWPWLHVIGRRAPARAARELGQAAARLQQWLSTAF